MSRWGMVALVMWMAGCAGGTVGDSFAREGCDSACENRICGVDGCGDSCGVCEDGELCNDLGTCFDPETCEPDCTNRVCGDDGCGGSCGSCTEGELCNDLGTCFEPNACTPDCANRICGDDGCAGSCGSCAEGHLCNDLGACYLPTVCVPDCSGRDCGENGCGGSCGGCNDGELCNDLGACYLPNVCVPDCAGRTCGDDGCGGSCGVCDPGELCDVRGDCYEPNACTPDCAGKECGDDGCGGSCGSCSGNDTCNAISGLCVAPVGLVWTDSIQSGGGQYGFDGWYTEHPIGNLVNPSDANGANLSRVTDPLGGPGYALRQYSQVDGVGARSELAIWSFNQQEFRDLSLSGAPVYVAQEWYLPEAIEAGGDGWAWLSFLDWHTSKDHGDRRDTSPGMMLNQDGSMRFHFAWGVAARQVNGANSDWSSIAMPVGEWFDIEMRWQFATGPTATVSVWINGELALEQVGVATAGSGHNIVEFYIKLYGGSENAQTPWSPGGATKYVRSVRISGERIWR